MGGLAAAIAAPAVLAGCSDISSVSPARSGATRPRADCVPAASMGTYDNLAGARLVYEVNDRATRFRIEPGFAGQFEAWLAEWNALTGTTTRTLGTYGSWLADDGACDSWHHSGRAFDVARVLDAAGEVVSCHYDLWGADPDEGRLPAYWALAAGLHAHFAYVLTYLYDDAHANHIHVDNGISGSGLSGFSGRSRVQIQAVQAICTHLWSVGTPTTGSWDPATRASVRTVLDRLGLRGNLTATDVWQGFLRGSITHWADGR
ncbi:hypothetical protein GA0111570_10669 [Raineyella antarctica]|uniref:Extensin-like protein C-terminus n=2 Tax=Raineyella antarctica TaxID=1577474 RepID=A0A1G6H380_9ACTN|nr:hypothetical protein GA0111570_10669 [Raineyella antarctica]